MVGSVDGSADGPTVVGMIDTEGSDVGIFEIVGLADGYRVGLKVGRVGLRVGFLVGLLGLKEGLTVEGSVLGSWVG